MEQIIFASKDHKEFFYSMLKKAGNTDVYHEALFYTLGLSRETRRNIEQLYDFRECCINPEGLHKGWQTGGTARVTRLAFNLWNGYVEEGEEEDFTPQAIFCCSYAPFFWNAIQMRFPEYG